MCVRQESWDKYAYINRSEQLKFINFSNLYNKKTSHSKVEQSWITISIVMLITTQANAKVNVNLCTYGNFISFISRKYTKQTV